MSKAFLYCELDVPRCSLTYGTAPCEAQLFVTGPTRCFNSPATCQDPANYDQTTEVIRWVRNSEHVPSDGSVPSLENISVNAQRIAPGESLGKRERVTASFKNHPDSDAFFDPYRDTRGYNPYNQGTFWGKFSARYPNIQGYAFRVERSYENDDGSTDTEISHYVAEEGSISSDLTGYQISARDALAFVEGNKTLCPMPSNGTIDRDLNDTTDNTLVLEPAGIGSEYLASGEYSMGKEYGTFTRSGDTITLTARGLYGSEIEEHDAGETFQQAAVITGNFSDILQELLTDFSDTPSEYITNSVGQWDTEAQAFDPRIYIARIAEPTELHKLIGNLMQDLGMDIHTDIVNKSIIARIIRPLTPVATLTDDVMFSLSRKTLTDKRISSAFIRYARRNPVEKMDEHSNYRGGIIRLNDDNNITLQRLTPAIRTHYSRWIPGTLRSTASDTAALMVDRYGQAPQELTASIPRQFSPQLGDIVIIESRMFEGPTGAVETIPMQVVKLDKGTATHGMTLEEFRVNQRESADFRLVSLLSDELNMGGYANLRAYHDSVWGADPIPDNTEVVFDADPNVVWGSNSPDDFSIIMGDWPEIANGVTIEIRQLTILGCGGTAGPNPGDLDGKRGGPAFYTRVPVTLTNCDVGGGGGGGGSANWIESPSGILYFARGGGGAGREPGDGHGSPTDTTGGDGEIIQGGNGRAGDGGNIGDPGQNASAGTNQGLGGPAGTAIDGVSFVTLNSTSVDGTTVN